MSGPGRDPRQLFFLFFLFSSLFFFPFSLFFFPFFFPFPIPRWAISSFLPAKSLLTRFSRPIPPSTLSTLVSLPFTLPLSLSLYSSILLLSPYCFQSLFPFFYTLLFIHLPGVYNFPLLSSSPFSLSSFAAG
ncbi:hypothetical protein ACN38_g7580 [Penicillium nordicum]|uniref:Uncharacterized protein n=1 Tax=Penicillium nordicum TaxID=229535 RepID=A0A0M8P6S0_9EURO|nr:hypothetical protein ACN38_g7580 [Penicillium nordicum]